MTLRNETAYQRGSNAPIAPSIRLPLIQRGGFQKTVLQKTAALLHPPQTHQSLYRLGLTIRANKF